MIILLLAQAAVPPAPPAVSHQPASRALPPPAMIIPAPPAPSMFTRRSAAAPRVRWSVVMRGGGAMLWEGSLWVVPYAQSSWRQSVQEAAPDECGSMRARFEASRETSISLNMAYDGEQSPRLHVMAQWARPGDEPCSGMRRVELRETVATDGTAPIVLRGDGGLVVELRRR